MIILEKRKEHKQEARLDVLSDSGNLGRKSYNIKQQNNGPDRCGAVASDGEKATWGQASSISAAKRQSLDKCEEGFLGFFKKHCEVKAYHCSFS